MTKENNMEMLDMIGRDTPEDEIESLRAQLAAANAEVQEQARLNGMGAEREAKLRAQLEEVTKERDAARSEAQCRSWEIVEKQSQLLATQAHAARLVESLDSCLDDTKEVLADWKEQYGDHSHEIAAYGKKVEQAEAALSPPINLDALHEALACECERLAGKAGWAILKPSLLREAAAHRAKKEGK